MRRSCPGLEVPQEYRETKSNLQILHVTRRYAMLRETAVVE